MATYGLFIILLTIPHVTFDVQRINNNKFMQYMVCTTDECTNTASEILAKLNHLIDPCDNFYKFACDKWVENNRANKTWPHVGVLIQTIRKTEEQFREFLEESAQENDSKSLLKVKQLYAQCMDNEDSNAVGQTNFSIIVNRLVEWPLTMSHREWDNKNLTWQNVSNILHENKFDNGLYDITVKRLSKITNSNAIFIKYPFIHSQQNNLSYFKLTNSWLDKHTYAIYIINIAKKFIKEKGGTAKIKNITQDVIGIINFEDELISLTKNDDIDNSAVPLTIQQLQEKYDKQNPGTQEKIDWYQTIQKVFASEEIAIEPSEKIVVIGYEYFTSLVSLLKRTPSRTIVNYMLWTVISEILKQFVANRIVNTKTKKWETCVIQYNLKFVILHEYVKKYLSDEIIQDIGEIITVIKNIIREQINNSTWIDESTREASLEKLAHMSYNTIKPKWYNDEAIDKYYESMNVSTTYIESLINLYKFKRRKMLSSLRSPHDETFLELHDNDLIDTPYYKISENRFVITPTVLQPPFYNRNHPSFINNALLGVIIGHEISHGLVETGSKYDKYGNDRILWSRKNLKNYKKIRKCFINKYNEYLFPVVEYMNVYVNGKLTLDENICDFVGIAAAYNAYKDRKARFNEPEWQLRGLEQYSNDQIFFLMYAQVMCEDALPEKNIKRLTNQPHPLNDIRIRGSFSNFPEFSAAYNCPVGSVMNPVKKCPLW